MLKNTELLNILCVPGSADDRLLKAGSNALLGAGYDVPIVAGVPDFVTHAPVVRHNIECVIPNTARPEEGVVKPMPRCRNVPAWFGESGWKFEPLSTQHKGWMLDIGAGHGNRQTYERLGYRYCGIDSDPAGLNSNPWGRTAIDLDLIADAHRLPIRSGCIQAINSTAVFEHLYNPAIAAREIARVLAPGGLLVGSCSFLEGEHYDSQHHLTALGIFRLFTEAGLHVISLYPVASLWELHASALYLGLPFSARLAQFHQWLYLTLVKLKSRESVLNRKARLAAIFGFHAMKPI